MYMYVYMLCGFKMAIFSFSVAYSSEYYVFDKSGAVQQLPTAAQQLTIARFQDSTCNHLESESCSIAQVSFPDYLFPPTWLGDEANK